MENSSEIYFIILLLGLIVAMPVVVTWLVVKTVLIIRELIYGK